MKKCTSCNIKYNTNEKLCPLCQNKLIGKNNEEIFPTKIRLKTNLLCKILLFITFATSILCGFIELCISNKLKYSLFVIGGLATNLVVINNIIKNLYFIFIQGIHMQKRIPNSIRYGINPIDFIITSMIKTGGKTRFFIFYMDKCNFILCLYMICYIISSSAL